jgi:hypothetical protein
MGGFVSAMQTASAALQAPNGTVLPPSTDGGGFTKLDAIRATLGTVPNVRSAMRANVADALSASVAPTTNGPQPNVGQPGSANNAGQIAGASGNLAYSVESVAGWQNANPGLSAAARIGLPVLGVYLISQGRGILGGVAIALSAPLWYAKLTGR